MFEKVGNQVSLPFLVIAGLPKLAEKFTSNSGFPGVYAVNDSNGIIDVTKELRGVNSRGVVYIIGDTLLQNSTFSLKDIIKRLTDSNITVIIVTLTSAGHDLHLDNPKTGEVKVPFTLNHILYALKSSNFDVSDSPYGNDFLYTTNDAIMGQTTTIADPFASMPNNAQIDTTPPQTPATNGWASPVEPQYNPNPQGNNDAPNSTNANPFSSPTIPVPASSPSPFSIGQTEPNKKNPFDSTPISSEKPSLASLLNNNPTPPAPSPWAPPVTSGQATSSAPLNNGWGVPQNQPNSNFAPPADQPNPNWAPPTSQPLNQSNTQTAPQNQWSAPTGAPVQNNYPAPGRRMDSAPTQQVKRKGYVITVGVPKGGVGKSSLTLNLAAFLGLKLRKLNRTVCVIDANFQQADSGKYIDTYTPNITEIARDPNILSRDRINEILVPVPRYNMSVLLGPDNPDDADPSWLRAHLFVKILDLLKEKFDYILIDTPVAEKYHEIFKDFALPQADYIIVPVAPNFPTLYNADNWLKSSVVAPTSAGGANVDRHKIGILLNMAQEGIDCSVDDVRQTLHEWSFIGAIPYSKEWIKASNSFELIAGKNFHDLHAVLAEVLNHATGEPALLEGYESFEEEKKSFFGRFRKKK